MKRNKGILLAETVLIGIFTAGVLRCRAADNHPAPRSAPTSTNPGKNEKGQGNGLPEPFLQRRPRYRVGPGDVLGLNFPFTPEFNQTVSVQPDGFITLRGLGDFYAQGKSTDELAQALRASYSKILHDPVITVNLKNFQMPYFIAGGQVRNPGKYDLRGATTLFEAVEMAGGLTEKSKESQVLLFRRVTDNYVEVKKVNLKKMITSTDLREDVELQPGDMFYVPKNKISKIARFLPTSSLGLYFSPYYY